jgi:hypothetical protein
MVERHKNSQKGRNWYAISHEMATAEGMIPSSAHPIYFQIRVLKLLLASADAGLTLIYGENWGIQVRLVGDLLRGPIGLRKTMIAGSIF